MLASLAAGCGVAAILVCGFDDGIGAACFTAGFLAERFADTVVRPAAFLVAGFCEAGFVALDFVSRAPDCFAASLRAVDEPLPSDLGAAAFAVLRATARDAAGFWILAFAVARVFPEPPARAAVGFALRSWAGFGRETLTNPRMALPDDRTFAAAFTVARRVDLLCEVEAIGSTLVTVVTR